MDRDGEAQLADSWVGLPGLDAGPVDHAWLEDGHGVLSCVAGHRHAPHAVAVCPFYLRSDVVDQIPDSLRSGTELPVPLRYRDRLYFKLTGLVRPEHWHDLVATLPDHHGLSPCAWAVFSALDPSAVVAGYDPRDALRTLLSVPNPCPVVELLARLAARLGDPGNEQGSVGITGSVALAPQRVAHAGDLDLLIYLPPNRRTEVESVLRGLHARFLADLMASDDRRLDPYRQSRVIPPVCQPATRDVFWSRRRDVAWVNELRIDLTWAEPQAAVTAELLYERQAVGPYSGELQVATVAEQFPVRAVVEDRGATTELHVTARGLQDCLLPGDRITVTGSLHSGSDGRQFVSVDDAAGHQLDLTT